MGQFWPISTQNSEAIFFAFTPKKRVLVSRVWEFSQGFFQWREFAKHDNLRPTKLHFIDFPRLVGRTKLSRTGLG